MSDETNLLFHVIYLEQECSFQLPKYDTVGDLKKEIFKRLGVAPYKQIIECWYKTPETDSNTLTTCCLQNDCNYLIVYNIEDSNNTPTNSPSHESTNEEYIPEETENSAIISFIQHFSSKFSQRGIPFHMCCLEDAFNQAFSTVPQRILLLYLHNKNDNFATTFCEQLTNPSVQTIINSKYFLLCWDIEKENFKKVLVEALHKHNELKIFEQYVESKTCCALLIAPLQSCVTVISVMKGPISSKDIFLILQNSAKTLNTEENSEQNEKTFEHQSKNQKNAFGSKEFQQLMLDMLGDRDYDSFDYYELDHLKGKIGYSLYGPPKSETGYEEKERTKINFLFDKILQENNSIAKRKDRVIIAFIYVCTEPLPNEKQKRAKKYPDYDPDSDLTPTSVFVLRKCKHSENPCRIFIDDIGRVYASWENYLENNKLPECDMIFPKNGRYEADEHGKVILDRKPSPACDITNDILQGIDITGAVGGIASGGVMVAAASIPAVAAAPLVVPIAAIVGTTVGAYTLGRSAYSLYDRSKHKESLSFFESPEARGAYINIVAGSLGFVGTGANLAVSTLAARGFNIGTGATAAVNTLNIINIGAGGAGIINASYDVIKNWWENNEAPSLLTIVQLSSSILFFGHAVYNYRSINTVIEESQANTLRDYQDSLRSNRHRKAFTKLLKETIRQNDGNVQRGQAEVISTIKNIQNKDDVFATLTRANKAMNRNKVRFAASNGEITLNGVAVDMTQFGNMQKNEVITFLTKLPNTPNPSTADIKTLRTYLTNSLQGMSVTDVINLANCLVQFFGNTDSTIREKIINAVSFLIKKIMSIYSINYMDELDRIFPNHDKYFRLFCMVSSYFQTLVNDFEERYARWLETQNPEDEEPCFLGFLSLSSAERIREIFNIVTEAYYIGTHLTEFGLEKLLNYFYTWFAHQVYTFEEREERRRRRNQHSQPAVQVNCSKCQGHYYKPSG